MANNLPPPRTFWCAIEVYVTHAYPAGLPPRVQGILNDLRAAPADALYTLSHWERTAERDRRLAVRLGNASYPHMKLVLEAAPDGDLTLFRADAHDAHVEPDEASGEREAWRQMVERNRAISTAIEAEWDAIGVPTFKRFLRDDLARRRASRRGPPGAG